MFNMFRNTLWIGCLILITGLQFQKQLILIKKLLFQNLEHIGYSAYYLNCTNCMILENNDLK